MTPIRIDAGGVEPVSLAEMRSFLRIDPDLNAEDALIVSLVTAARTAIERESRRLLVPGRYRIMLTAWPADGVLPLPLSPLVSVERAGTVGADGTVQEFDKALLRLGHDPWDAPCLLIDLARPALERRAALIEVAAGCGGAGPPVPAPFLQAIRLTAASWFENRGDTESRALPPAAADLIAPYRLMRL